MSFLIDPPWLYANGRVIAKVARQHATPLGAATVAVFLVTSISLYLNHRWTAPIWRMCRADDGRDWMINSGVLHFDHRNPRPRTHAASALIFATYPLWLWLGYRQGRSG